MITGDTAGTGAAVTGVVRRPTAATEPNSSSSNVTSPPVHRLPWNLASAEGDWHGGRNIMASHRWFSMFQPTFVILCLYPFPICSFPPSLPLYLSVCLTLSPTVCLSVYLLNLSVDLWDLSVRSVCISVGILSWFIKLRHWTMLLLLMSGNLRWGL